MIITITIFCIVAAIMMSSFFSCAESAMTGASEAYMADLEKNILNLGSVVTEEDRSTDNSQQTSEYSHAKTYENHE